MFAGIEGYILHRPSLCVRANRATGLGDGHPHRANSISDLGRNALIYCSLESILCQVANIPFSGGLNIPLWKLPYILPLGTYLPGLRWMPDAFAAINGVSIPLETAFRLRTGNFSNYPVLDPTWNLGAAMQSRGMTYGPVGAGNTPQYALYGLPAQSQAIPAFYFLDVMGAGAPTWSGSGGDAIPCVAQNQLAWWYSGTDNLSNTWNALIFPSGLTQGWFASPAYQFGNAFWQDLKNNRTLGLYQPSATNLLQQTVFDSSGNITSTSLISAGSTGYGWLDQPQFSSPWVLPDLLSAQRNSLYGAAWLLVGDNTAGGVPLVTGGAPLFSCSSRCKSILGACVLYHGFRRTTQRIRRLWSRVEFRFVRFASGYPRCDGKSVLSATRSY